MFKFSIRDLLLLTVITALGIGWWSDHRRQARQLEKSGDERMKLAVELQNTRDDLKNSPTRMEQWRRFALQFAELLRQEGWFVEVDMGASGVQIASPEQLAQNPEQAKRLRSSNGGR